ncbi:MAG: hypothetical protein QOF83_1394 [Solirubrobacteraceae bacterium]|jgi:hypothetical protein|nr:hypothetical protein [Solirubrobacteraceae bacterium]
MPKDAAGAGETSGGGDSVPASATRSRLLVMFKAAAPDWIRPT